MRRAALLRQEDYAALPFACTFTTEQVFFCQSDRKSWCELGDRDSNPNHLIQSQMVTQ